MSNESDQAYKVWATRHPVCGLSKTAWDAALEWSRPIAGEKIKFLKDQVADLVAAIDELKAKKKRASRQPKLPLPQESFTRPDWIPFPAWEGFEDMRRRIKAPLTDRARQLTINSLLKLKKQGEDPVACLDQSTQCSWRGVFPVHRNNENGNGYQQQRGFVDDVSPLERERQKKADAALLRDIRQRSAVGIVAQ